MTINSKFLIYEVLETLYHIAPLQPTPTPGFDSTVKTQVRHFVDQQRQNNDGSILWSLNFHVIHHKKVDDTSCHIAVYLASVFYFARGKIPMGELYLGVGRDESLYPVSPKFG